MEPFVDNRKGGAHSFSFATLDQDAQALYTATVKKLRHQRECSGCGVRYTIGGTVGNRSVCGANPYYPDRDHFDWSTEPAVDHAQLVLPVPIFHTLRNSGEMWHLQDAAVHIGDEHVTIKRKT